MIVIPLGTTLNHYSSNSSDQTLPSKSDITTSDYVDYIYRLNRGSVSNFYHMTQDTEGYAIILEGLGGSGFVVDQIYYFVNVNPSFDFIELHFDIRSPFSGTLDVLVGPTPVSLTKVGEINHVGDNFFNVKPFLTGGVFYVKITDNNNPVNSGPIFVKRLYLLMTIQNVNPSVNAGVDQHAFEGDTVDFNGIFTDSDIIDTHTIEWDFGDGTGTTGNLAPSHLYEDNGIFSVVLTVTDNKGGVGSDSLMVNVDNIAPIVEAGSDKAVNERELVFFDGSFTDPGSLDTYTIEWDFGDGTPSASTITTNHHYSDNGVYIATLTVTDDDGGSDSDSLMVSVNNVAPVVASVGDKNTQEGSENSLILATFADPGDADTHEAIIDWGDGTIEPGIVTEPSGSVIQFYAENGNGNDNGDGTVSGVHTYEDNGIYMVVITVTDDDGDEDSDTLLFTVTNEAPMVDVGIDLNVDEGDVISFNGIFLDSGSLDTHTIVWDFGDETGAMGSLTPAHIYEDDGVYTATLTVTDDDGGTGSDSLTIVVNNVAPMVSAGEDQIVNEGEEVSFNGIIFDLGGLDTHTFNWDLGDGTIISDILNPTHSYVDNGVYTVTLSATDDDGGSDSDTAIITVNNIAPTVDAGTDQIVDEGDLVSFSGSFTDPGDADTHIIEWNFGDGTSITDTLTPTHTYRDDGIFLVTITVTDNDGGTDTDTLNVAVNNVAPVVTIGNDQTVNEGDVISFSGSFMDPGSLDTHKIEWNFGDGTILMGTLDLIHIYEDNGKYAVTLTVTDDDGGSDTDTILLTVNNIAPIVDAGSDIITSEGDDVNFGGNFVDPGGLDTHTLEWAFGDGTTAVGTLYPVHNYEDNGIFIVSLTVTDDDGDTTSDTLVLTVNNVAPTVTVGSDIIIDEGDTVSLIGTFFDPGVLDSHTIEWDFGDGATTSDILTTMHTYEDNGYYTATLTITDNDGGVGSNTLAVTVNNVAPSVVVGSDLAVDEGQMVAFSGSFTDPGILDTHSATWDFGDGSIITGTLNPTHIYGDNGKYPVTLTVADNDGDTDTDTLVITVNNVAPSVLISEIESMFAIDAINATGSAYDPGSDDLTFIWNWGDSTDDTITIYANEPPTFPVEIEERTNHTFGYAGEFLITLTVMDDDGGIGTDSRLVEVSNPRELKLKTLIDLENLKTGDKCFDKKVDHVIKFVEISLCESFWINSTHLDPRKGQLVFIFEMIAVKYFQKFIMTESNEFIIQNLVKADEILAETAINLAEKTDVINPQFQWKYDCYLSKAQKFLDKGKEKSLTQDYLCAMFYYLRAWAYSQYAIKWATKETHSCHCCCK
jgi:PKD repeat protein